MAGSAQVDPTFWAGRRVLLTGHTGFKGAWLSMWLEAMGASVTGYSLAPPTSPSLFELADAGAGMREIEGDIADPLALGAAYEQSRPEVVFHLAAQAIVRRSYAQPAETYRTNVIGTLNVLEAARSCPSVAVFINVTSDKCYENEGLGRRFRESDPLGGDDPYSSSKAASELLTHAYRASFFSHPGAARIASARAGNVIGGGDFASDRLFPDLMRAAVDGRPASIRNPAARRPWQHVLNPLSGYLLLAQALWSDARHAHPWNFGPRAGDARVVEEVVEEVARLWPGELAWELDQDGGPAEAARLEIDSGLAEAELGWRPPVGLDRGLRATVDWYAGQAEGADLPALTRAQLADLAGCPLRDAL